MSKKLSRSEQREQILQLLYEKTFHEEPVDEQFELANIARDFVPSDFISEELSGIIGHIDDIDAVIEKYLKNRKLSRVPRVPLCIMRIAVYEMLYCEGLDTGVSINEAVNLAKKYASEEDKSYINGILGAIDREIKNG